MQGVYEDVGIIGGARNVGVEYSNGEFIVFTDTDCVVDRDWLKNLLREFKDENVGTSSIRITFWTRFTEC